MTLKYWFTRGSTFKQDFIYSNLETKQPLALPVGASYRAAILHIRTKEKIEMAVAAIQPSTVRITGIGSSANWPIGDAKLVMQVIDSSGNILHTEQTDFFIKEGI